MIVRLGTTDLASLNVAGMTLNQIAIAIGDAYVNDGQFNAQVTGPNIQLFAQFTGTDNPPMLDITPGQISDGTPATLAAARDVINDGQDVTVTGETTQLTATIGDTSMTVDLTSGASAIDAANQLVGLINMFQLYSAVVSSGSTVTASSIRAEVTADLTVTVGRAGTGGTIQVVRT